MGTQARPVPVWNRGLAGLGVRGGHGIAALVATGTFLLAYANGTYTLESTSAVAIGVWWAVLVAVVVGARGVRRSTAGLSIVGLLAAFTGWTLASAAWAGNAEAAYAEFARDGLYLGLLVLVITLARRAVAGFWADGLALGILAVAALALASRLYPDTIGSGAGIADLPALRTRLSYPIGYWNALGVLAGIGAPLVLGSAQRARSPLARSLFLAGLPLLGATIYLTSSRGAFATAGVGMLAFLALSPRRWATLGTVLLGGASSGLAILVFSSRSALTNGLSTVAATNEGRSASGWLAIICLGTAASYVAGRLVPRPPRPSVAVVRITTAVAALAVLGAIVAAHPIRRFDAFKQPPPAVAVPQPNSSVQTHLLSGSSSGRWQFWRAAVTEFDSRPLLGRGAGSYAEWWAQHGTLARPIQDAHSLYLETLGELGIVGLALFGALVVGGLAIVIRAARTREDDAAFTGAAAAAAFVAFLAAAGIDWMWELPAVTAVAVGSLGLAVVLVPDGVPWKVSSQARLGLRLATAALVVCIVAAEGVPLLTQVRLGQSRSAARQGRIDTALADARAAIRLQPWAATPYLQLGLVDEQAGTLRAARVAIGQAIARDRGDWQLALVAARLDTELGHIAAARRSYERARALNPRSPLFASG